MTMPEPRFACRALPAIVFLLFGAVSAVGQEPIEGGNKYFAAPEMLMVGEAPLNQAARQMYPSPAMFDIDGDNQVELIVGDIFGTLNIYENERSTAGDPVWSPHVALKSAGGEAIKVSNW